MRIWVDVENLPDVLFFDPLLRALRAAHHEILITARHETNLPELCAQRGWNILRTTGHHAGHGQARKVVAGLSRSIVLASTLLRHRPHLLVNFVSRPAILAAVALRVPVFTFFDYEHVALPLVGKFSTFVCLPDAIPDAVLPRLGIPRTKVIRLPGTKEDIYAHDFIPSTIRTDLQIPETAPFALIRPPARQAHYHDPRSEALYDALIERIATTPGVHARIVCRTEDDRKQIETRFPGDPRVRHLDATGNGLNLIWNADLVVSGGGTMTREAAALGVPAFSIFTGTVGAVDRRLFETGQVVPVQDGSAVMRIPLVRVPLKSTPPIERHDLVEILVRGILRAAN